MTKNDIRKTILQIRSQMSDDVCTAASKLITNKLLKLQAYIQARNICLYMPIRQEVDVSVCFDHILKQNKQIWLPKIIDQHMDFFLFTGKDDFTEGTFHIKEPLSDVVLDGGTDTLVVMPGAVFSLAGDRIGYGGGYYDRYMEKHPNCTYIAVCYDFQILDTIPYEAHDQKPSCILSEKRMLSFDTGRR